MGGLILFHMLLTGADVSGVIYKGGVIYNPRTNEVTPENEAWFRYGPAVGFTDWGWSQVWAD